jgi:membrane protein DedA with SNARE-associated domain
MAKDVTAAPVAPEQLGKRRRKLQLLIGPMIVCFIATGIGVAFAPVLLERAPIALFLLAPLGRHLVLISPALDPVTFVAVGMVGYFLVDPFSYVLGREYGQSAVEWMSGRAGLVGRWARWVERMFNRAAPLVLFVSPGPFVNLLAGASGMRVPLWLTLNLGGTLATVILTRWFGAALVRPINAVREFVQANALELTVVSVILVLASTLFRRRRRRSTEDPAQSG